MAATTVIKYLGGETLPSAQKGEARLKVLNGPDQGIIYRLFGRTVILGRHHDAQIALPDTRISRHHAQIVYEEGAYFISDLKSANGVFVNNQRILNQQLHTGDIILIGQTQCQFYIPEIKEEKKLYPTMEEPRAEEPQIEPPTDKKISPLELLSSFRTPLLFFAGMLFLMVVFAWLMRSPTIVENRLTGKKITENLPSRIPTFSSSQNSLDQQRADIFFQTGFKEFRAKNYSQALLEFNAALNLAPHPLVQQYRVKALNLLVEEVENHLNLGIHYLQSIHREKSFFHLSRVLQLVYPPPSAEFCQKRDRNREIAQDNRLWVKYCEAQENLQLWHERAP